MKKTSDIARFTRCQSGALTVEAVLWVPVYLFLFVFIADVSLIFHGQAKATRIAYDGNRMASVGSFETASETSSAIRGRVQLFSPQATVNTVFGSNEVTTTVVMPAADLAAIGLIGRIVDLDVTVQSVHMRDV
ncbi:MAG: pilus assembly protein [Boseongicola sp.]|nr:pilus assembly protein [Boseongicola sp.]